MLIKCKLRAKVNNLFDIYNFSRIFLLLSLHFFVIPFNLTCVLLGITVVTDTAEQDVTRVFLYLVGIVLLSDLRDSGVGRVVVLQLDDNGWMCYILTRNEHKVGIAVASLVFSVYMEVVAGTIEGQTDDARHGVLVVILEQTHFTAMDCFHTFGHGVGIATQQGVEQALRSLDGIDDRAPVVLAYGILHLHGNLAVGQVALAAAPVESEVTQMDKYGEHVVAARHLMQVVATYP